jgi:hypothetical protein
MIPARALGSCRRCGWRLSYNMLDHPYCDRCDCVAVASVCYHCGTAERPVYEAETVELAGGFQHEIWYWNCPACGGWRVDVEHQEMGSGNSRRLRARVARFVDHWRFAIPFYLRRLFATERNG